MACKSGSAKRINVQTRIKIMGEILNELLEVGEQK